MNKKSGQILRDKVFSTLMQAIVGVCPSAEDAVTFEKLGEGSVAHGSIHAHPVR